MHPILILIPAAALIIGPRAWVNYLLKKHNQKDLDLTVTAGELAREVLDRQKLQMIKVESTDIGDHYDHHARAVRIDRNRFDRKSLTAVTTTAHEVAHALQDASNYAPFVWRIHLTKVAQVAGQVGSIMLVTVPLFSLTTHRPFPIFSLGTMVFGILGIGLVAQLAALPSEFDASFNRALPMLRSGYIEEEQVKDARMILVACSMTYIAASMVSILNFWPWFIRGPIASTPPLAFSAALLGGGMNLAIRTGGTSAKAVQTRPIRSRRHSNLGIMEPITRRIGKPLIRCWLQLLRSV